MAAINLYMIDLKPLDCTTIETASADDERNNQIEGDTDYTAYS
jgi:hypothetical protein